VIAVQSVDDSIRRCFSGLANVNRFISLLVCVCADTSSSNMIRNTSVS
jgi:hypothetical protein